MEGTPPSLDEVIRKYQLRQNLNVLIPIAIVYGLAQGGTGLALGSPRTVALGILTLAIAAWLAAVPRRQLVHRPAASIVAPMLLASSALLICAAFLQPLSATLAGIALLVPIEFGMPYLEGRPLRRLMILAWAGSVAAGTGAFLPDDTALPALAVGLIRLAVLALVSATILYFTYLSGERLKASGREFRRLLELTTDLAETMDPGGLGNLVARHLAEATGFDDCVIYELTPKTGRFAPFGSHPAESALETGPVSRAERPMLGRVLDGGARIVIDVADVQADPTEQSRLRGLGRQTMLLMPLMARQEPVGVAELTSSGHHSVDERRLAFASTLAFTAGTTIENGRLYQELRQRSLHDPLTGLANSSLFHDRVEHALARLARREGAAVAVLFLDIDDFKAVNDALGHARGDALLALVAERLRAVVRPADTAARLGGDEFALLLEEVASPAEALAVAGRAVDAVAAPFELAGRPVRASVSIGVACRSADDGTVEELVAEADAAMYEAKMAGKGRAVLSRPGLRNAPVLAGRRAAPATHSLGAETRAPGGAAADRAGESEQEP